MICSLCKEDKDTTEFYTRDGVHHNEPIELCDSCVKEKEMKSLLCEGCYEKWRGFR